MKNLLFFLFLTFGFFANSQSEEIEMTLSLDEKCGFDSILLQSNITGQIVKYGVKSKQPVNIFAPVDIVIIMAEGENTRGLAFNIPVEKSLHISAVSEEGCNNLKVETIGQKRMEEYEAFLEMSEEKKQAQLLPLIQKNAKSINSEDSIR